MMRSSAILARNLKLYRHIYKLSQEEVAQKVKISCRGYGKIERGEVAPSLDTLDKLSQGLNVPTMWLISENMLLALSNGTRPMRQRQKPKKKKEVDEENTTP